MSIRIEKLVVGELGTNCYLVISGNEAIIIDPGGNGKGILQKVEEQGLKVKLIVNTHGHYDHIKEDDFLREKLKAPLAIHAGDKDMIADPLMNSSYLFGDKVEVRNPEIILSEGDEIKVGEDKLKVLSTPGHTPGSISLLAPGMIFVGDLLFKGSVGRSDLPGGSAVSLFESLRKLSKLPRETLVFPGHGEETTLSLELEMNPFLREAVSD